MAYFKLNVRHNPNPWIRLVRQYMFFVIILLDLYVCVYMCLYLFLFFKLWRLRLFIIILYNVRNKASRGNKQLRIIFVLIAVIFIVHAIPSRLWLGVLLYVYYWLSIRVTIYSSIKMISTISMILRCVFVCTLCRFYFDIFYFLLSKYRKYAIRSVRKICRCNVITN